MSDFPVKIFHNPACGTSRNALAAIRQTGIEPQVIEYLETGWTEASLHDLLGRMKASPRDVLREKGAPEEALALIGPNASDDALIAAMVAHPVLVNRPIVETPLGVVMARPSERVFDVLENCPARFVKEDGEVVEL